MIRAEQLWLAVEAVDMRLGIDGLSLKIQESLGRSPRETGTGKRGQTTFLYQVGLSPKQLHRGPDGQYQSVRTVR